MFWVKALVLDGIGLPGNVAEFDGVNCQVKIVVVNNRWGVIVGDQRGTPDIEEAVNDTV